MRYNPGAQSCRIAAGIGGGKVLLWHEVGKRWSGKVAADLYKGPIVSSMRRNWPRACSWTVLEDNDPTGFKSTAGKNAKRESKIKVFAIPKRSPDLNVCDYALWKKVIRTMRRQEKKYPRNKRETRGQYVARLRRNAVALPRCFINDAIGGMVKRCAYLYAARGGHVEEGGR